MSDEPQDTYYLEKSVSTPSHISSLAFGHAGNLFAGSNDGTLRVYELSNFKVVKAIRGLGAEISSIVCVKRPGVDLRDCWIAHGQKISKFQMETEKMIQDMDDALVTLNICEGEDDVLNELVMNSNKSHLAFSTDSGHVGVIDLSNNNNITKMFIKHESICGSVKFIPDRPRELVSGGYDSNLFHFDLTQRKLLSRSKILPYMVLGGMSMSPPFITSMAISNTGVLAVGTADGRVCIYLGGEKSKRKNKKKAKKWEGLDGEEMISVDFVVAGPIVAMAFNDTRKLTVSSLKGTITQYGLIVDHDEGSVAFNVLWKKESKSVEKVNALIVDECRIAVGGLSIDCRGLIEIWKEGSERLQLTAN